jgi:hypothetical protein
MCAGVAEKKCDDSPNDPFIGLGNVNDIEDNDEWEEPYLSRERSEC